jgi:hypothetical protein
VRLESHKAEFYSTDATQSNFSALQNGHEHELLKTTYSPAYNSSRLPASRPNSPTRLYTRQMDIGEFETQRLYAIHAILARS